MILKVGDGDGGWILFGPVDKIHILPEPVLIQKREDLDSLESPEGHERIVLVSNKRLNSVNGKDLSVGLLSFEREDDKMFLLFSEIAYICNDNGDTIEAVSANRKPNHKQGR